MSLRVVIDPGVFISSTLVPLGNPAKVVESWRQERFELIVSPKLLVELGEVMSRDRLQRRITPLQRSDLLELLNDEATLIDDPTLIEGLTADPRDDYLASLVLSSCATHLVTGDRPLRKWEHEGVAVVTPRAFLEIINPGD